MPVDLNYYIENLALNKTVFKAALAGMDPGLIKWREHHDKWNPLEVICHLYDEEREDFRARVQSVLENPDKDFIKIDPVAWVKDRRYLEQDFNLMLDKFLDERDQSVTWLKSLTNPPLTNAYIHPKVGPVTGDFLLANWLAHDYLHLRQITRIQYNHLKFKTGNNLDYAGSW